MLYVIRHGRTDWNAAFKLQGNTDIPLNEEGRQMARTAAKEYAGVHFDICYCSPLIRAVETAKLLLEGRNIPIVFDERLREIGFGPYEGTDHVLEHPESPVFDFFHDPMHYVAPEGAESIEHLCGRASSFLDEEVAPLLKEGKDILIVAHGALNSAIITCAEELPISQFWSRGIPNCKLLRVI